MPCPAHPDPAAALLVAGYPGVCHLGPRALRDLDDHIGRIAARQPPLACAGWDLDFSPRYTGAGPDVAPHRRRPDSMRNAG